MIAIEFQPRDLWIGAYWKPTKFQKKMQGITRWDIWICLLPTLPLHIWFKTYRRT